MNVGAVVSEISMVWVAVELFPHASDAVNVRTKVYVLSQSPGMVSIATVTSTALQSSVAVASSKIKSSEHSALNPEGTLVNSGAVESVTVIV